MLFNRKTLSIILVSLLLVILTENTVKANCGCARCNKMQQLSAGWYHCCLYCVVNGKRSSDFFSHLKKYENDDAQETANDLPAMNDYYE
jgi:hypothetical protein